MRLAEILPSLSITVLLGVGCTPDASGLGRPTATSGHVGDGSETTGEGTDGGRPDEEGTQGDDTESGDTGGSSSDEGDSRDTESSGTDGGGGGNIPLPPTGGSCTFIYENAIVDGVGIDIYALFLTPVTSPTWGADLLGDQLLPFGATAFVEHVPYGRYDTMVVDVDGFTYSRFDVTCDEHDWYWTITLADLD